MPVPYAVTAVGLEPRGDATTAMCGNIGDGRCRSSAFRRESGRRPVRNCADARPPEPLGTIAEESNDLIHFIGPRSEDRFVYQDLCTIISII
jgi:hypothetical protein